jgi:maleate isomerase
MYGWRLRIGLIVPSSNTTMEPEFYQHLPQGASVHTARITIISAIPEELAKMPEELDDCVALLKTANVDVVVFGCTSGSFLMGKGYDRELEARIEKVGGVPAVTTSHAVLEALKAKAVQKLAIATPYIEEINEQEVKFFSDYGFTVEIIRGLNLADNLQIGNCEPSKAYQLGLEVVREKPDVDGLFISCTNFRTFEIIEPLSRDIEKPVITSNQASLWMGLKTGGISYPI